MYDNTSIGIIEQVYLSPGIHKRELSKQLNLGMPSIEYSLRKINRLLKKQKSGNQIKYFLDYAKPDLTPALTVVEYSRIENLPAKIRISVREILKGLGEKPVISLIFGSYASRKYTQESDIDIFLVFQKPNVKNIEDTAKKISMMTSTRINPVYLDYNGFRESFHNPTKQFFKNIRKDKILLTGIEWWRQLNEEET